MTEYVVGFAFDTSRKVALIRKTHPDWQKNLLNGIGGKLEEQDKNQSFPTDTCAMVREFQEETGLLINAGRWKKFHQERWPNGNVVSFFAVGLLPGEWPESKSDEQIVLVQWDHWSLFDWRIRGCLYNLHYLVPMAYCFLYDKPELYPFHAAPI